MHRPWPCHRTGIALLVAVAAEVSVWRFAPFGLAAALAVVLLIWGFLISRRLAGDHRWLTSFACLPVAVALILLASSSVPGLWPCDVGCGGGAAYEAIGGLDTPVLGLLAALTLLVASFYDGLRVESFGHRTPPSLGVALWGWLLIGGSLYFLITAWRLGLTCRQCGAFQTTVLALLFPLRAGAGTWWQRLAAVIAGVTLMISLYGVALHRDLVTPTPATVSTSTASPANDLEPWTRLADDGRLWGRPGAPLRLDLAIDFQCPHCAESFDGLMAMLEPRIAGGEVRLAVISVVRPSEPASATLAAWGFAAAARGEHQRFVRAMLGSRPGATADEIAHGPASEVIDLGQLGDDVHGHAESCEELITADQRTLSHLGYQGQTPFAVLLDATGTKLASWSVAVDPQRIDAAISAHLGRH